jgi:hypothetical protein
MWNDLSSKEKAKYIALGVQNGATDIDTISRSYNAYIGKAKPNSSTNTPRASVDYFPDMDFIRNYGKKFEEGGDTQTQQNNSSGSFLDNHIVKAIGNYAKNTLRYGPIGGLVSGAKSAAKAIAKPLAYSILAVDDEDRLGASRDAGQIMEGIINAPSTVKDRKNKQRELLSLYLYGNDLGQFEEAPELVNRGVEYDKYLRSVGRDPKTVKTYKGNMPWTITLPDFVNEEDIADLVRKGKTRTYGNYMKGSDRPVDTVANYLQRISLNAEGKPEVVNSDLWDFQPKEYSEGWGAYGGRLTSYLQAKALDVVGTPFILKDIQPINYVSADDYYRVDPYTGLSQKEESSEEILKTLGVLPEVTLMLDKSRPGGNGEYYQEYKIGEIDMNYPDFSRWGRKIPGRDWEPMGH